GYIVTHVDRATKYLMAQKIESKTAEAFNKATLSMFMPLAPSKRLTLTLDNGKEFSLFNKIENRLKIDIYFADPYCSWQRGTNENTNGLIRRYFPKKTDFSTITDNELQKVVHKINSRPRKSLDYQTPKEAFSLENMSGALGT
ncbi:IS30 family transposase, partial [Pseudoalteromonas luteoviolacea]